MQVIPLLIALVVFVSVRLYFHFKNRKIKEAHLNYVNVLIDSISIQKKQIDFRNNSFKKYNFLKFNLEDSLIIQPEIQLN